MPASTIDCSAVASSLPAAVSPYGEKLSASSQSAGVWPTSPTRIGVPPKPPPCRKLLMSANPPPPIQSPSIADPIAYALTARSGLILASCCLMPTGLVPRIWRTILPLGALVSSECHFRPCLWILYCHKKTFPLLNPTIRSSIGVPEIQWLL